MMVHVQFRLDRGRRERLDGLVMSSGESRSDLMREAVDLLFTARAVKAATPEPLAGWDRPLPLDEIDQIA